MVSGSLDEFLGAGFPVSIRCLRIALLTVCGRDVETEDTKFPMQPLPSDRVELSVRVPQKTGCRTTAPLRPERFLKTLAIICADLSTKERERYEADGGGSAQRQVKTFGQNSRKSKNDRCDRYVNREHPCLQIVAIKYRVHHITFHRVYVAARGVGLSLRLDLEAVTTDFEQRVWPVLLL